MRYVHDPSHPLFLERVINVPLPATCTADGDLSTVSELRHLYGETMPTEWLEVASKRSYPQLVAAAHAVLAREGYADRVRTVVLALATPDSQHRRLLGGYTTELFDSHPNTFAVTEQGMAGPFTAIILANIELQNWSDDDRALVLVLEQSTLPPARTPQPRADAAIALVLTRTVGGRPVELIEIGRRRGEWATREHVEARTISGESLRRDPGHRGSHSVAAAAVWQELGADETLRGHVIDTPIVLTDVDSELGYECVVRLGVASLLAPAEAVVAVDFESDVLEVVG